MSKMIDRAKDCLLFLSHHTRPGAMTALAKMAADCSAHFNMTAMFDQTHGAYPIDQIGLRALAMKSAELEAALPYPEKNRQHPGTLWPSNVDLPMLWFFKNSPTYRYYWLIEYDVRYSGPWPEFFANFETNESDLLAATVFDYDFRPTWGHWASFDSAEPVPMTDRVRATLSFYRLSNRGLCAIDRAYRNGATGHYEVAIPTILKQEGLTIEDMGGSGAYVKPGNHNRFYINAPQTPGLAPGTFVLHPEGMIKKPLANMLWNPVKD